MIIMGQKGLRDPGEHGEDVIWHDGCGRNDAESGYRRYFPEFEVIGIRQDSSAALINMTSGGMQTMEIPLSTLETFGYYVSDFFRLFTLLGKAMNIPRRSQRTA